MPSLPMTNTVSGRQVMRWYHLSELAGTGRRQMTTAYCLTGCVPVIAHAIQTYKVCISEAIHVESLKKVQPELPGRLSILSSLSPLCRDADDRGDAPAWPRLSRNHSLERHVKPDCLPCMQFAGATPTYLCPIFYSLPAPHAACSTY
jgi:hypothetical protein